MKALVLTSTAYDTGIGNRRLQMSAIRGSLHNHRIPYTIRNVQAMSASAIAALSSTYDFVVMPYGGNDTNFAAFINTATLNIPVIMMTYEGSPSGLGATPGITGGRSAVVQRFNDVDFTSSDFFVMNGRYYTLSTGTALMTVSATSPIDGSAQSGAGGVFSWKTTMAGGQNLYVSSAYSHQVNTFILLLQKAITDGAVSKNIPRKAPLVLDIDHVNGESSLSSLYGVSIIQDIKGFFIRGGGTTWGGQQNGLASVMENMEPAVAAELALDQPNPFKYCYHSHRSSGTEQPNQNSPIWPNLVQQITKDEENTIYDADEAIWNGHGLTYHTPAYYNAGANNWNDHTLELFSEDVSKMSSPLNDSTVAGKGFRGFRLGEGRHCSRVNEDEDSIVENKYYVRRMMRGIQLIPVIDVIDTGELANLTEWYTLSKRVMRNVHYQQHTLLHDGDFQPDKQGITPSLPKAGYEITNMLIDIGAYCSDTIETFADPINYIMPRHSGGVDGVQY